MRKAGRANIRVFIPELLMKLFSRTHPYHLDLYIFSWSQSRHFYDFFCELDNFHWVAHLKHIDVSGRGQRSRLQHKLHGLRDSHEVTGHLLVRNRDRSTGRDLAQENWNHAAAASEHITKTYA